MPHRPESFWKFLGSTFTSVQGVLIGVLGIVLALMALAIAPTDSISLGKALAIIIICIAIIITLLVAAFNLFLSCRDVLPRVLTVKPYLGNGETPSIMFLLEPSQLFTSNQQVSVYYYEDRIEQPIGLGTVVNIQEDGHIQIALVREFEGHNEIFSDLRSKRNFDFSKVKIKPSVPQFVPAPIQKSVELETNPDAPDKPSVALVISDRAANSEESSAGAKEKQEPALAEEQKSSSDLYSDLVQTVNNRDFEKSKLVLEEIQRKEADAIKRLEHEAFYFYLLCSVGEVTALDSLVELTQKDEIAPAAHFYLGLCYEEGGAYEQAVIQFEMSAKGHKPDKEPSKTRMVVLAANSLFNAGKRREAFDRLISAIGEASDVKAKVTLYEGLASLYEKTEEFEMKAIALELAIILKPNDVKVRFDTAFAYSKKDYHHLTLLHYKFLLGFSSKHQSALNNIGVAYSELSMPLNSVYYYKQAIELNSTLAASNLAYLYLQAGFSDEASRILAEANQKENVHENVAGAVAAIPKYEERENKTEAASLEQARKQQKFLQDFGSAYFVPVEAPPVFQGVWRSTKGIEITTTQTNDSLEAIWKESLEEHKFTGNLRNRAARISTYRYEYSSKSFSEDGSGFLYLSLDGQKLFLMSLRKPYWGNEKKLEFLTMERIIDKENSADSDPL